MAKWSNSRTSVPEELESIVVRLDWHVLKAVQSGSYSYRTVRSPPAPISRRIQPSSLPTR